MESPEPRSCQPSAVSCQPASQHVQELDMGPVGFPELVVIFVVALIVFGPRKLPEIGKSLGKSLAEFKRASNELRRTLEEEIRFEEQRSSAEPTQAPAPASTVATSAGGVQESPVTTHKIDRGV